MDGRNAHSHSPCVARGSMVAMTTGVCGTCPAISTFLSSNGWEQQTQSVLSVQSQVTFKASQHSGLYLNTATVYVTVLVKAKMTADRTMT